MHSLAPRTLERRQASPPSNAMKTLSNRLFLSLAAAATFLAPVCSPLQAATTTTVASGLRAPTKATLSKLGNLIVAEAGNGPNTGRVSIVDPATGARRTLLDGLPSAFAAPNNDPSGPSSVLLVGRTLYVTIGTGDAVVNGPVPMTTVPNPAPASPVLSSVLAIHFSAHVEKTTQGFALTPADHAALKAGAVVVHDNGAGDRLTVELVADFDNYVPEPRPDAPTNVRASNPFGVTVIEDQMFVVDASMNNLRTVDLQSGTVGTLTSFTPVPNTRGFGPPVSEAVPDSIHVYGDALLVTELTGFPFPPGQAKVLMVDSAGGATAPVITGLTSAIDVLAQDDGGFYTLEYTADMLAPLFGQPMPPGKLKLFSSAGATPVVLTDTLPMPTSMARDEKSGAIYVTEIFAGKIVKVSP